MMWATAGAKASAVNNSVDIFKIHICMGYAYPSMGARFPAYASFSCSMSSFFISSIA